MTAPVGPVIIGYDNLVFTQFSSSQVYTADTAAGLVLNGTVFSAKVDNNTTAFDGLGNIIVKASANLVTPNIGAATGTSLVVTGNVSSGNLDVSANITGGNLITAGLTSTATLTVTGNANVGNLGTAGQVVATGNITGGNLITSGNGQIATLTVSTLANITATTAATSNVTGALTVAGGVGIGGNLYAGDMYSNGDLVLTDQSTIDGGLY
jgi:hypothetical protein